MVHSLPEVPIFLRPTLCQGENEWGFFQKSSASREFGFLFGTVLVKFRWGGKKKALFGEKDRTLPSGLEAQIESHKQIILLQDAFYTHKGVHNLFYIIKEKTNFSAWRGVGVFQQGRGIWASISRMGVKVKIFRTEGSMCQVPKVGDKMIDSGIWKGRTL